MQFGEMTQSTRRFVIFSERASVLESVVSRQPMACKECRKLDLQSLFKIEIKVACDQVKGKWCTQDGARFPLSSLTLPLHARGCPQVSLPHVLALGVHFSSPHQPHLSIVTFDLGPTLIKIFQDHPTVNHPAEHMGDLGSPSSTILSAPVRLPPLGCRPGSCVFHPCSLNGSWAFLRLHRSF